MIDQNPPSKFAKLKEAAQKAKPATEQAPAPKRDFKSLYLTGQESTPSPAPAPSISTPPPTSAPAFQSPSTPKAPAEPSVTGIFRDEQNSARKIEMPGPGASVSDFRPQKSIAGLPQEQPSYSYKGMPFTQKDAMAQIYKAQKPADLEGLQVSNDPIAMKGLQKRMDSFNQPQAEPKPKREKSFWENAVDGFWVGLEDMKGSTARGISEMIDLAGSTPLMPYAGVSGRPEFGDYSKLKKAQAEGKADSFTPDLKSYADSQSNKVKGMMENRGVDTESWGYMVGSLIPQGAGIATAVGVGAINPAAGLLVGAASTGQLTSMAIGSAAQEYDEYVQEKGAEYNPNARLGAMMLSAAAETVSEAIPVAKFIPKQFRGKMAKFMFGNTEISSKIGTDLIQQFANSNESRKQLVKNVLGSMAEGALVEGPTEAFAELGNEFSTWLYKEKEDRATFTEMAERAAKAVVGGSIMGAGIGPISFGAQQYQNRQRRQQAGKVVIAQDQTTGEALEIVGVTNAPKAGQQSTEPLIYQAIRPNGKVIEVSEDQVDAVVDLSLKDFDELIKGKSKGAQLAEQEVNTQVTNQAVSAIDQFRAEFQPFAIPTPMGEVVGLAQLDGQDVFVLQDQPNGNVLVQSPGQPRQIVAKNRLQGSQFLPFDQFVSQFGPVPQEAVAPFDPSNPVQAGEEVEIEGQNYVVTGVNYDTNQVALELQDGDNVDVLDIPLEAFQSYRKPAQNTPSAPTAPQAPIPAAEAPKSGAAKLRELFPTEEQKKQQEELRSQERPDGTLKPINEIDPNEPATSATESPSIPTAPTGTDQAGVGNPTPEDAPAQPVGEGVDPTIPVEEPVNNPNKLDDEEITLEQQFELNPAQNTQDIDANLNEVLSQYSGRAMGKVQAFRYLTELGDLGKQWAQEKGITSKEELDKWVEKTQSKARSGKGAEKKQAREFVQSENTKRNVDEIEQIALQAAQDFENLINQPQSLTNDTQSKFKQELINRGFTDQVAQSNAEKLTEALNNPEVAKQTLLPENKNLRDLWSKETGVSLPNSLRGTMDAIDQFFMTDEEKQLIQATKSASKIFGTLEAIANATPEEIYNRVPEATPEMAEEIHSAANEKLGRTKPTTTTNEIRQTEPQPETGQKDVQAPQNQENRSQEGEGQKGLEGPVLNQPKKPEPKKKPRKKTPEQLRKQEILDREPTTARGFARQWLLNGGKLNSTQSAENRQKGVGIGKGVRDETGMSGREMRSLIGIIDNKNGLSPEVAAERIHETMNAEMADRISVQDLRNALIEVILSEDRKQWYDLQDAETKEDFMNEYDRWVMDQLTPEEIAEFEARQQEESYWEYISENIDELAKQWDEFEQSEAYQQYIEEVYGQIEESGTDGQDQSDEGDFSQTEQQEALFGTDGDGAQASGQQQGSDSPDASNTGKPQSERGTGTGNDSGKPFLNLNPSGNFTQALNAGRETLTQDQLSELEANGRFLDQIMGDYPQLTQVHENEIFDLINSGADRKKIAQIVANKANTIDFDASKPLNLSKQAETSPVTKRGEIERQIKEIQARTKKIQDLAKKRPLSVLEKAEIAAMTKEVNRLQQQYNQAQSKQEATKPVAQGDLFAGGQKASEMVNEPKQDSKPEVEGEFEQTRDQQALNEIRDNSLKEVKLPKVIADFFKQLNPSKFDDHSWAITGSGFVPRQANEVRNFFSYISQIANNSAGKDNFIKILNDMGFDIGAVDLKKSDLRRIFFNNGLTITLENGTVKGEENLFKQGTLISVRDTDAYRKLKYPDRFKNETKDTSTPNVDSSTPKMDTSTPKAAALVSDPASQPVKEQLQDVGEKIGGAKKDGIRKYFDKINLNGRILSNIFPKPDIASLLDSGMKPRDVGAIKVAYEFAVQDKKEGPEVIKFYAAYAKTVLAESINLEFKNERYIFSDYGKSQLELRSAAYEAVHDQLGKEYLSLDLSKARILEMTPEIKKRIVFSKNPIKDFKVNYYSRGDKYFDTKEEAIQQFVEEIKANTKLDAKEYKYKPGIFSLRRGGGIVIGLQRKGKEFITLKDGFKEVKEASEYLKSNIDDIQLAIERILAEQKTEGAKPRVTLKLINETSRDRVGKDWRNGKDVSSKEFADTFGFRGVEFGNWVNMKERQAFVNATYDSFMDLAQLMNITPEAISLGKELAITFGSRGSGQASAHYEPGRKLINLTKTKGLGSLAHEWFHGVDNYFAGFGSDVKGMKAATLSNFKDGVRPEIKAAFDKIYKAIESGQFRTRSMRLDQKRNMDYYATKHEMAARAFENYVLTRLNESGQVNDFLANYVSTEDWRGEPNMYPYPIGDETIAVREAFDELANTLKVDKSDPKQPLYMIIGERGASRLDQREEATVRMDKLAIAREMEQSNLRNKYIIEDITGVTNITMEFPTPKMAQDFLDNNPVIEQNGQKAKSDRFTVTKITPKEQIRLATGWERGADGKWRYEIQDGKLIQPYQNIQKRDSWRLVALLDNKELLRAVPNVATTPVQLFDYDGTGPKAFVATDPNGKSTIFMFRPTEQEYAVRSGDNSQNEAGAQGSTDPISDFHSTLLHEVQHLIQDFEGFGRGADPRTIWQTLVTNQLQEFAQKGEYQNTDQAGQREIAEDILRRKYGRDFDAYLAAQGEVEARNVQGRARLSPEERRANTLQSTEDVAREDQIFLDGAGVQMSESVPLPKRAGDLLNRPATPTQAKQLANVQAEANRITGNWKNGPSIEVYPNGAAIEAAFPQVEFRDMDRVPGLFYDGKVILNAAHPFHNQTGGTETIILHESIGHFGMGNVINELSAQQGKDADQEYARIMQDVYDRYQDTELMQYVAKTYFGKDPANLSEAEQIEAGEEYIAHTAQTGVKDKWIDGVIAKIREILRKLGFKLQMADAELRAIIGRASRFVVDGPSRMQQNTQIARAMRTTTPEELYVEVVNGFYSPIEQRILDFKQPKASATKWKEIVGKKDEAQWTGIAQYLDGLKPDQQVTKQELLDWMKDNRVKIEVVQKGGFDDGEIAAWWNDEGGANEETNFYDLSPSEKREARERYKDEVGEWDGTETKYSQYQLEGDKTDYKEVLVTLPVPSDYMTVDEQKKRLKEEYGTESWFDLTNEQKEELKEKDKTRQRKPTFKSSHFDEPNILVHLRMNTRTDAEGNKVLFLEEVQSDWGQKGKKEGFGDGKFVFTEENQARYRKLLEKETAYTPEERLELENLSKIKEQHSKNVNLTPQAPFVTDTNSWVKLGLKVAMQEAVAQGADRIAWTTGTQQNERYDLSKQVDYVQKDTQIMRDGEKNTYVDISLVKGGMSTLKIDPSNGNILEHLGTRYGDYTGKNLEEVIGKEITEKILNAGESARFQGKDLQIGGTGMKAFYGDPSTGDIGIVGRVAESLVGRGSVQVHNFNESFENWYNRVRSKEDPTWIEYQSLSPNQQQEYIDVYQDEMQEIQQKGRIGVQHSIPVTPALIDQVQSGLPMFMRRDADQTQSPAFKAWFGDSKVVDENGKPLVVYHGTNQDFNEFKSTKFVTAGYFAKDPQLSSEIAKLVGGNSTVMPVYLSLQNPLDLSELKTGYENISPTDFIKQLPFKVDKSLKEKLEKEYSMPVWGFLAKPFVIDYLKSVGFDGVIFHELTPEQNQIILPDGEIIKEYDLNTGLSFIAFQPTQIKSATGNVGTFSPTNPDIRYTLTPSGSSIRINDFVPADKQTKIQNRLENSPNFLSNPRYMVQPAGVETKSVENQRRKGFLAGAKAFFEGKNPISQEKRTRARENFQDAMLPGRRMIERKAGDLIKDESNFYVKENLAADKVVFQIGQMERKHIAPIKALTDQIQEKHGVTFEQIEDYLGALHNEERRNYLSEKNPDDALKYKDNPKWPTGMTDEEAKQIIKDYESKVPQADRDKLNGMVKNLVNFSLDTRLEAGLISQAYYDQLKTQYDFYVPLRGWADRIEYDPTKYSPMKEAKGRISKAASPLAYLYADAADAIAHGERNKVFQSMYQFVMEHPDKNEYMVKASYFRKSKKDDGTETWVEMDESEGKPSKEEIKKGTVIRGFNPEIMKDIALAKHGDLTLPVFIKGQKVYILFAKQNEQLVKALKNTAYSKIEGLAKFSSKFTGFLSSAFTEYSPEFGFVNGVRDMQMGNFSVILEDGPEMAAATMKKYPKSIKELYSHFWNQNIEKASNPYLKEFMESGAFTGFSQAKEVKDIYKMLSNQSLAKKWDETKLARLVSTHNKSIENAYRFAYFQAMREKGYTVQKAASKAKDVTVNFRRRGNMTSSVGAYFAFFNAGVQGIERFTRPFFKADTRNAAAAVAGTLFATGFMQAAMYNLFGAIDEEDDELMYDKIPEFTRSMNIIIPFPNATGYVTVPMGYGLNVPYALGELTANVAAGKKTPGSAMMRALTIISESFSPLGGYEFESNNQRPSQKAVQFVSPTFSKPIIDLAINSNFFGARIIQEQPWEKGVPNSQLATPSTSKTAIWVSEMINSATGGDDVVPGNIDLNPTALEYLAKQYGGGPLSFGNKVLTTYELLRDGENPLIQDNVRKAPFVSRFYQDANNSGSVLSKYFKNREEVLIALDRYESYLKTNRPELAEEYYQTNRHLIEMENFLKSYDKGIKSIRKAMEAAELEGDQEEVKQLKKERDNLMKEYNAITKMTRGDKQVRASDLLK